ncbi:MAG: hypothetical protein KatS3mg111_1610 [Pirellulaceae bacterium]|nr:MAG: hypothetical protein KatS3mg111_1610 [Pirellulaceae bacterium]
MNESSPLWRCEVLPLPHQQLQFRIDGRECTRWHWSADAPRPYFWPLNGPSGISLTRMGHPGAANHDHHRSLWFAHQDVLGIDCWTDHTPAMIRQTQRLVLDDGADAARAAWRLHWLDGHDPAPLLQQDVVATIRPLDTLGAWTLELQCDFLTSAQGVAFRQSNFGILGLRVAKSLSRAFGAGIITGADGGVNEQELFGRPNRWIDYSGPIAVKDNEPVLEGIAIIDHRQNPGHREHQWACWHVRDDGWFGPSLSRHQDVELVADEVLRCRYLIVVHAGPCPVELLHRLAEGFDQQPAYRVIRSRQPHRQYELTRDG